MGPADSQVTPAGYAEPCWRRASLTGMTWLWRSGAVLLTACAAVTAAGCAAGGEGGGHRPAGTATVARTKTTPRDRAVADAAAILKEFVVPPLARRLRSAPGPLKVPITSLESSAVVHDASFWEVPGRPRAVLAWERAHLPRRFTLGDADFGPPSWDRMFSLPPVPGVLTTRELIVEVTGAGHGQTRVRADAWVSWQPRRSPAERVPAGARVVTITARRSLNPRAGRRPAPVTITDLAVVRRLAALVDSLPLSTIGPMASCPLGTGGGIRLVFLARAGGPPLAVAQGPAACGTVQFSVGGRAEPALQLTSSFIPQVLKLAGLHWKVP